jgi:putative SOS response-associated peptidase YedK
MPTPPKFLEGKKSDPGVTNIRNTASSHRRRWLGVDNRGLVPFTSFSEPDSGTYGGRAPVWFAFDEERPLAFFAGAWMSAPWAEARALQRPLPDGSLRSWPRARGKTRRKLMHPRSPRFRCDRRPASSVASLCPNADRPTRSS